MNFNQTKSNADDSINNPKKKKGAAFYIIECILLALLGFVFLSGSNKGEEVSYNEFQTFVEDGTVQQIDISLSADTFTFYVDEDGKNEEELKKWNKYKTENPKYDDFKKDMLEKGIAVNENKGIASYTSILFNFASIGIMGAFLFFFMKSMSGESILGGDGPSDKKISSTTTFKDVAGLSEVKSDLLTVVDFMKNPKKYTTAGAKLPKGILLYGPPGTGKTLLAKAVAGEANVNFIASVGSEFDEKFVGVGAQRIRKIFADARKKAPCIIFIDEIDALGGKRGSDNGSRDRQTINQLLSEMDGFSLGEGIMVVAATNRIEDLDSALIRPGRFDSHFAVPLPANAEDRLAIINIYSDNKKYDESVDLNLLAKETLGCSPADIEAILNDAAIIAATTNNGIINKASIDDAFYKQVMKGHKKKDLDRKEEEIKLTAWHESGHALLGVILGQDVTKVTIVPSTSGAGGVTFFNQQKMGMYSKTELENEVKVLYAGRCAEEILVGKDNITTGASNDISEASKVIKSMIGLYGMSEYGLLDLNQIGVDNKEMVRLSVETSQKLYNSALALLKEHEEDLKAIATTLLEKETISGDEVKEIINM